MPAVASESIAIPSKVEARSKLMCGCLIWLQGWSSLPTAAEAAASARVTEPWRKHSRSAASGRSSSTLEQVKQLAGDWCVRYLHPA